MRQAVGQTISYDLKYAALIKMWKIAMVVPAFIKAGQATGAPGWLPPIIFVTLFASGILAGRIFNFFRLY
jgi:hypothetical protein